jgi:hypothetical protein
MEAGGVDGGGEGLANGTVEEIVEQIIAGSHGLPDDDDQRTRFERLQMQRIRELDMEQLEVEDVDSETGSILGDNDSRCFPFMPFLSPPPCPLLLACSRNLVCWRFGSCWGFGVGVFDMRDWLLSVQ